MFIIKNQIRSLYASSILGNLSLTGAWVAILASRGFSLVEIGLAETCYHAASLLTEIPSGTLADVFGRKKMLIVSTLIHILASAMMILSNGLALVCLSIALYAVCDSFASGSGDALAFDSLKSVGQDSVYDRYESNQLIIYRLCNGVSTLCAGFALIIGYRVAYATGIVTSMIQIGILASLKEIQINEPKATSASTLKALLICFRDSLRFLRGKAKAFLLMMTNSLVGAADILLLFFLQAKLPTSGIPGEWLGPALFVMQLGGILGAKLILKFKKHSYRTVFITTAGLILAGILLEHTGVSLLMTAGGFIAALADDALQVRTNTRLQAVFPSEQRATLISIECFTFSIIMIVLSPLAGFFFSIW